MTKNGKWSGRGDAAFTLVELLVAIGLMMILISSCVLIFSSSSTTVMIGEARIRIYNSARATVDQVTRDLSSMLPVDGGSQLLWMKDAASKNGSSAYTDTSDAKRHYEYATDQIGFTAVTSVKGSYVAAIIVYRLVRDPDPDRGKTVERYVNGVAMPARQLYILRKEYRDLNGGDLKDAAGVAVEPGDLCYYVISFNIEYLSANGSFSQIAPGDTAKGMPDGPFPGPALSADFLDPASKLTGVPVDPMGEIIGGDDLNDEVPKDASGNPIPGKPLGPKFVVPAVRVTLRIVEDREARQERVITREVWLPAG